MNHTHDVAFAVAVLYGVPMLTALLVLGTYRLITGGKTHD